MFLFICLQVPRLFVPRYIATLIHVNETSSQGLRQFY